MSIWCCRDRQLFADEARVRAALAAKQPGAAEQAQQLLLDVFDPWVLATFAYEVRHLTSTSGFVFFNTQSRV
jgi:hypothetical protein